MSSIVRDCPYCGKTICIDSGRTIPADIVYSKTKRHTVVLAHKNCIEKEIAK